MALTFTTHDCEAEFTLDYDRYDGERYTYKWCVAVQRVSELRDSSGEYYRSVIWYETIATGTDLRSGAMDKYATPPSLAEMMGSFASFLGAFAESHGGENSDLFPEAVEMIANTYADELYSEFGDLVVERR